MNLKVILILKKGIVGKRTIRAKPHKKDLSRIAENVI